VLFVDFVSHWSLSLLSRYCFKCAGDEGGDELGIMRYMQQMPDLAYKPVFFLVGTGGRVDQTRSLPTCSTDQTDRTCGTVGAEALELISNARLIAHKAGGLTADEDCSACELGHGIAQIREVLIEGQLGFSYPANATEDLCIERLWWSLNTEPLQLIQVDGRPSVRAGIGNLVHKRRNGGMIAEDEMQTGIEQGSDDCRNEVIKPRGFRRIGHFVGDAGR